MYRNICEMKRITKSFILLFTLLLPVHFLPTQTLSAEYKADTTVDIKESVNDNLYIAAESIRIKAGIEGDLIAAARNISIDSSVTEDINLAAESIDIDAEIGGDARLAGNSIRINKNISGDALIFAQTVEIDRGVTIGGDLNIYAQEVDLNGNVSKSTIIEAESISINGSVSGNLESYSASFRLDGEISGTAKIAAENINLEEDALFKESVQYWTKDGEDFDFGSSIAEGVGIKYNEDLKNYKSDFEADWGVNPILMWFLSMLSGILVISILMLVFKKQFRNNGETIIRKPLHSLGSGFLYFVSAPVISILLFITLIGLPLGILGIVLYIFSWVFAIPVTATAGAFALDKYQDLKLKPVRLWLASIVLQIALSLLLKIPFVGFIIVAPLVCTVFGGFFIKTTKSSNTTGTAEEQNEDNKDINRA
jgi:cytoskeletal protein CcmA (bactofilin family)